MRKKKEALALSLIEMIKNISIYSANYDEDSIEYQLILNETVAPFKILVELLESSDDTGVELFEEKLNKEKNFRLSKTQLSQEFNKGTIKCIGNA